MLRYNIYRAKTLDSRFRDYVHSGNVNPHNNSVSIVHDMRVGVQESEFVRPSLNRNAKKRHHTICSQHGELLEYMYQDDDFERIRRRYNQAHPFDVHDEAINPDGEWEEYNWCHDELWQELMHDNDPDPMGAMMAAMGRYLLFYRYQHNVENLGSNRKYNNGQPSLRSHSIPYYYRQLTAAYPTWNEGITSVGSGCNNLLAKYPTWKMFLEDVNAILSCGRYADVKRAQPVFGPLRQQISATLPPFSVGLATMLLNGIIQNNAIRAITALSVELADVYEMEEADDRSDGGSRGGLMYRDNLLCEEDRINFGGDSDAEDEADDLSYVPDYRLSGSEDESDGDVETEYERSTHSSGVSGLHDVLEYERLPNSSESDGAEAMNEDEYGLC